MMVSIHGIKEWTKKSKLSQEQMYQNMSFEKDQLHFHIQGNILNWPAALVANACIAFAITKEDHRDKGTTAFLTLLSMLIPFRLPLLYVVLEVLA
jgi:hypothetical protein